MDKVLTQGLSWFGPRDVGVRGLDLGGSFTWTDAEVRPTPCGLPGPGEQEVAAHPAPALHPAGQATAPARPGFAAAYRWASSSYNTELNLDTNPIPMVVLPA